MTSDKKAELRAKYNRQQSIHDMPIAEAAKDIKFVLDSMDDSPAAKKLRDKYNVRPEPPRILFWIVADDINALLDQISPTDGEPGQEGKAVTP